MTDQVTRPMSAAGIADAKTIFSSPADGRTNDGLEVRVHTATLRFVTAFEGHSLNVEEVTQLAIALVRWLPPGRAALMVATINEAREQ